MNLVELQRRNRRSNAPPAGARSARQVLCIGALGLAMGFLLGIPSAAHSATTDYVNGNVYTGTKKSSAITGVRGGSVEAVIGGRASAVIRTLDVFGTVRHSAVASEGTFTSISHALYLDGKSQCYWYNWDSTTASSYQYMHCRVTT